MGAQHGAGSCPRLSNNNFILGGTHLSRDDLRRMRQQYDRLGSNTLFRLDELYQPIKVGNRMDLFALLREHKEDRALGAFWKEVHAIPEWVDWSQIERGQKVFWRYGFANLLGFAMQGFMGGNAATPSIAEVLIRTGGFSTKVVLRRALETFQGLLQTTRSLNDLKPGGDGHVSLIRIRLLHARVRQRIMKLCEADSNYFNIEEYGVPINSCDDVHTIALFACNPVWLELPAMGLQPRDSEISDYIALFRYVAYVLGVPENFFAKPEIAKRTMESFCVLECQPTDTSKILCYNFVTALRDVPPVNVSLGFINAASRVINGDDVSDALGIGRPGLLHLVAFRTFCWLAQFLVALQRFLPAIDEFMIETQRTLLYNYIVESSKSAFCLGGASKFDIKHVPRIGKKTTTQEAPKLRYGFIVRMEWFFLAVFMLGCSLALALCVAAWRIYATFLVTLSSLSIA